MAKHLVMFLIMAQAVVLLLAGVSTFFPGLSRLLASRRRGGYDGGVPRHD
jgi:hypothetical protein